MEKWGWVGVGDDREERKGREGGCVYIIWAYMIIYVYIDLFKDRNGKRKRDGVEETSYKF